MKKIAIIMLVILTSAGLKAQDATNGTTHKMWLGGSAGFGTDNIKDGQTNSNWNVGPSFGFFLNNKMAIGINLSMNGSTTKQNNTKESTTKTNGWNAEPFFRYYFAGAGNFRFFGEAFVGFGGGKTVVSDNTPSSNETKYGNFGVGVRPGFQYWFNNNWSMASTIGVLGYTSVTNNKGGTNSAGQSTEVVNTQFNVNANFSTINFAFYFHF